jgi:hypothetical protein
MTKLVLSEGHVRRESPISVQLIKNQNPEATQAGGRDQEHSAGASY